MLLKVKMVKYLISMQVEEIMEHIFTHIQDQMEIIKDFIMTILEMENLY